MSIALGFLHILSFGMPASVVSLVVLLAVCVLVLVGLRSALYVPGLPGGQLALKQFAGVKPVIARLAICMGLLRMLFSSFADACIRANEHPHYCVLPTNMLSVCLHAGAEPCFDRRLPGYLLSVHPRRQLSLGSLSLCAFCQLTCHRATWIDAIVSPICPVYRSNNKNGLNILEKTDTRLLAPPSA